MRLTINVDDELINKVDVFASEKYINRTSAICVLLSNALQSNDISKSFASLNDINAKLDNNG
jgi:metal-responsive CopG/Arc/MetJ family transcriptional regulator